MRRFLTLACVLGCYTATTHTSRRTAETFGDWSTPSNVASLNTSSNDEYAVLSRDGLTIYFTSDRPGSQIRPDGRLGLDLWFATRDSVDSPIWSEPQNMGPRVNSAADDSLPFLSANEHVLYFYSSRPAGNCGPSGTGDIWMTRRRNKHSPWQEPTNLGCVLNTSFDETAPAFFEDPQIEQAWLFFGSKRPGVCPESCPNGIGDYDVYASPLGEDRSVGPGILVPEFSSPARDTRIFIRNDGLEAFITSNRAGSLGDPPPALDIWVSTRGTLFDPWSVPTNLGNPVNSTVDDVAPWLSKDGTTLYFSSNRPGGYGMRDIWYTTRVKLND
jgi:hypothetical protein